MLKGRVSTKLINLYGESRRALTWGGGSFTGILIGDRRVFTYQSVPAEEKGPLLVTVFVR